MYVCVDHSDIIERQADSVRVHDENYNRATSHASHIHNLYCFVIVYC